MAMTGTGNDDILAAVYAVPGTMLDDSLTHPLAHLGDGIETPPKMQAADLGRQHHEPTAAQLAGFKEFQDVANWAKVKGLVDFPSSMLGSLLDGLGFEPDVEIGEFASLDIPTLTDFVRNKWMYSLAESSQDGRSPA